MKTNVRIDIPSGSPDDLIKLGTTINGKHVALGAESPLSAGDNMTKLKAKLDSAEAKRKQAKELHQEAEALNQKANLDLGIGKTQTSKTEDTLLFYISAVRDILQGLYRGREEEMSNWGFNVVSGGSSGKSSKTAK